jgi:hypothetical protein
MRVCSQLKTQIISIKDNGEIILSGDFNTKIQVKIGDVKQESYNNDKLLEELINDIT